jgi:type II secretion system protein H
MSRLFSMQGPLVPKFYLGTSLVLREILFRADWIGNEIASASAFPNKIWERGRQRGFTLLEMIMVLVIIAIMAGVSMPSIESAFTEQAVRKDTHQLALMVKTAMIQSAEQHRPYVIDLTATTMALHPEGEAAADTDDSATTNAPASDTPTTSDDDSSATSTTAPVDVEITTQLDPPNQLLTPDPQKSNAWIAMPDGTEWVFEPGELCPATRIRMKRGEAWIELSFAALTGNVENETNYLP